MNVLTFEELPLYFQITGYHHGKYFYPVTFGSVKNDYDTSYGVSYIYGTDLRLVQETYNYNDFDVGFGLNRYNNHASLRIYSKIKKENKTIFWYAQKEEDADISFN